LQNACLLKAKKTSRLSVTADANPAGDRTPRHSASPQAVMIASSAAHIGKTHPPLCR
jgi:hypothetical protein